jgi:hypothetical protein
MAPETEIGYWRSVWKDDLQQPLRDFIRQFFFLACTALLEWFTRILDLAGVPQWLKEVIHRAFDGLTVITVGGVVITVAAATVASGWAGVRKFVRKP